MKCLLNVSCKMIETPAPVSNTMRRLIPLSGTGISIPIFSVQRLYDENENGSVEPDADAPWGGSGS